MKSYVVLFLFVLFFSKIALSEEGPEKNLWGVWINLESGEILPDQISARKLLGNSWRSWMSKQFQTPAENLFVCDSSCNDLNLKNDYLIKIHLSLKDFSSEESLKYSWEGRVVLYEMRTQNPIATYPISKQMRSFLKKDSEESGTVLLNLLYQSALSPLFQLKSYFEDKRLPKTDTVVKVLGFRKISDALELIKILEQKGQGIKLKFVLKSFGQNEAIFQGFFSGEEKDFKNLFSQLLGLKSFKNYNLINLSQESSYNIKMI